MTKIVVLLHDIRSTFNVGSILRTSDGLGVNKLIFSGITPYPEIKNDPRLPHERDKITSQIAKTALGAETSLPIEVSSDIKSTISRLKASGYKILALEQSKDSIKLQNYHQSLPNPGNIALLLGEEVHGIHPHLLELTDARLEIPMLGAKESFNVSVAYAITLWELRRQDLN
ncbi:TrmH family RNA methyltransferase [Candidatus Saccharibacteria bacterium]|nr:TrmH family RNA methyltransferase [Candidatus Saccharibacteria bacterium]